MYLILITLVRLWIIHAEKNITNVNDKLQTINYQISLCYAVIAYNLSYTGTD